MIDAITFRYPEIFKEQVAIIKADKTADGYGPALAKAFDALPDEQKPSFLFASKDIDPLRKAFGAGHAVTSTLLTVGTVVPAIIEGMIRFDAALNPLSFLAGCAGLASGIGSYARASEFWRGNEPHRIPYRMIDVEYAMWRMAQVEKGEISPIRALGAGLLNGFKHNAVSMTCRCGAIGLGVVVWGLSKGAAVLSRGLFGSSEISSITRKSQSMSDQLGHALELIPGKSYCLVKDADMPLVTERLMAIRDAAYIRRNHRVACLGPDA